MQLIRFLASSSLLELCKWRPMACGGAPGARNDSRRRGIRASWGRLGASWRRLGGVLGPSWVVLGHLVAFWNVLGASWGRLESVLGATWGHLGGVLEAPWERHGVCWGGLKRPGAFWGVLGRLSEKNGSQKVMKKPWVLKHLRASWVSWGCLETSCECWEASWGSLSSV